jgi:hypothetical protein
MGEGFFCRGCECGRRGQEGKGGDMSGLLYYWEDITKEELSWILKASFILAGVLAYPKK